MKLVIRAADYGMVDCITDGCLKAIRDGVLNCVGLMTNNYKYAKRAAELIKQYPHVEVGQEINLVSGIPASDPKDIPSLVNEEGRFLTSQERIKAGNPEIAFEDAYREVDAQMKRFVELMGRKPTYFSGHSYSTPTIEAALTAAGKDNGFIDRIDIINAAGVVSVKPEWYKVPETPDGNGRGAYTAEIQKNLPVTRVMVSELDKYVNDEYVWMNTHCGYCDGELCDMSTFNVIRGKECQALCSPELKNWIESHDVEMTSFEEIGKAVGVCYKD